MEKRRPRRHAIFGLCAIALALASCGEDPPAPRGQGIGSYWSQDMSLVKIWYARADPAIKADRPPDFVIPRAYIKWALPDKWPDPETLPDEVRDVTTLTLFLAHDNDEALPVAKGYGRDSSNQYGFDRQLYTEFDVYVSPTKREGFTNLERPLPRPGAWTPGTSVDDDGYVRVESPNGLYKITMCGKDWKPRATQFCGYLARLTPKIAVHASFSDYRTMRGLPFAERVLSMIKKTLCKYNDCTN